MFVSVVWHDEDFVEQRLDVCPVPHGAGGSESESDGECVVVVVELHQVEKLELVVEQEQEIGSCCALGFCPQTLAYWTQPYSSSVASSLLH